MTKLAIFVYKLLQLSYESQEDQPMIWFWGVLALGFLAAVSIGSLAWYNSKRPLGWESAEIPSWADQGWAKSQGENTAAE
ncbi:photosystem II assembly protein Psb35 [Anthocerotibacter panamensis]|uniref:photosystem II assembly protein Psb35 n=1 Tax=Anthocerotibacter panamensis TaxID=2857077 RepID=UPI001C406295|nr:hypothetical protein [Anthocerotibacter panamensis]